MMVIDNKFNIGDIVYVTTDQEQLPRIVTSIKLTMAEVIYVVFQSTVSSEHYDFELSREKVLV